MNVTHGMKKAIVEGLLASGVTLAAMGMGAGLANAAGDGSVRVSDQAEHAAGDGSVRVARPGERAAGDGSVRVGRGERATGDGSVRVAN